MSRPRKITVFLLCLCLVVGAFSTEITIRYPAEKDLINAAAIDSNFIFGQVSPRPDYFSINGSRVRVYDNGAFLAWLPIDHDTLIYACEAISGTDTTILKRTVIYTPPVQTVSVDCLLIDSTSIQPQHDLELTAGDVLNLSVRGTPGCRAFFSIDSVVVDAPMRETRHAAPAYWGEAVFGEGRVLQPEPVAGLYTASYRIQSFHEAKNAPIKFKLLHANGDTVYAHSDSLLTIRQSGRPQIAETKLDLTVLRTGPRKSYYYFLPDKVPLHITGKMGSNYRVTLSNSADAWIEGYKIRFLDNATIPHHYIRLVRTKNIGAKTRVTVYGEHRVPYRIVQSTAPNQLKVVLYGVTADTDWIRYDFSDPLIRDIQWEQVENRVWAMTIHLNQNSPWGYDAGFDEHDNFFIDIKKTPAIYTWRWRALKDLTILLDPGHEPDTGAVGPTGFTEKDANLLLANVLADKLRRKGAIVTFTHTGEGISLLNRLTLAMKSDADILLSLHHNAIPAGVNPYKSRGTSTYYYHPQSRDLAQLIHKNLLDALELNDFGLYWDNLAMCRPTQMPAVLLEPAFMMHPEEEMLIQSSDYRERCSDAIVNALVEFVHTHRD